MEKSPEKIKECKDLEDKKEEIDMSYVKYVDDISKKNKFLDKCAFKALKHGGKVFGGYVRDNIFSILQKKPKNVKDLDVMFYEEDKFFKFIKSIEGNFHPVKKETNYSLHCNKNKIKFKINTVEKSILFVLMFEELRPSKRMTRFLLELCIDKTIQTELVSLETVEEDTYIIKYKYTNTKDPQESDINRPLVVKVFENYPNMVCVKFIHKYVKDAVLDIVFQIENLLPIFNVNNLMLEKEGDDILKNSTMRCEDKYTTKEIIIKNIENKRLVLHGSIYKLVSEIPDFYNRGQYIKKVLIPWFDRLMYRYFIMKAKNYLKIPLMEDVIHNKIIITEFKGLESIYYHEYITDDSMNMTIKEFVELLLLV